MIYDCFIFFNEIELLLLRMKTLNNLVDKFVIVEIGTTHTNKPKPYYFDEFAYLFREYESKIIRVKRDNLNLEGAWVIENAHRNLISEGIKDAGPEDIIMISDVDEIPNPETIKASLHLNQFSLVQDLFCFYVNCKSNQEWVGTVVSKKKLIKTPQDIRNNRHFYTFVRNGGWHYSSMGGKERIRLKFDSFAETDFNLPSLMSDANLDKCLETGKDLTDRQEDYAQKRFITESEITHKEILEWKNEYPNFYK